MWSHGRLLRPPPPRNPLPILASSARKHAERLLSSLSISSPSSLDRTIKKSLSSTPLSLLPATLSLLLSHPSLSPLAALSLYRNLSSLSLLQLSPKHAAAVVSLLESHRLSEESQEIFSKEESRFNPAEISDFYCFLFEEYAKKGMREKIFDFPHEKISSECLIKGFCLAGFPLEAEKMIKKIESFNPFYFRLVIQSYAKLGMISDMERVIESMVFSGILIDTVSCNLIISCYGENGILGKILVWLRKMGDLGMDFSIRTCNSALNSCPDLSSMISDCDNRSRPISIGDLIEKIGDDREEGMIIREVIKSRTLLGSLIWSDSEGKIDLHGYHLNSAFVAVLQLIDEMNARFSENDFIPRHIIIVCGSGKNSTRIGESPVKKMVSSLLHQMGSPFKIDRKNVGRVFAGGSAVRDWLIKLQ